MIMKQVLKLNVESAKELKNVHFISTMNPFAVVSVAGHLTHPPIKTLTDPNGRGNPLWNFYSELELPLPEIQQNRFTLVFDICSTSRMLGNRYIGRAVVPVRQLLESSINTKITPVVTLPVTTPSGRSQGQLTFSYEFSDVAHALTAVPVETTAGDIHAPTTASSGEKKRFLVFSCVAEFFARAFGTAGGDLLSNSVL